VKEGFGRMSSYAPRPPLNRDRGHGRSLTGKERGVIMGKERCAADDVTSCSSDLSPASTDEHWKTPISDAKNAVSHHKPQFMALVVTKPPVINQASQAMISDDPFPVSLI
jgi:hypothetical protein